jgi:ankyrin repeat protein
MPQKWLLFAAIFAVPAIGQISLLHITPQSQVDASAPALIAAAARGGLTAVTALLYTGAHVNVKDDSGQTALMVASAGGHLEVVQELIAKGADVNAKTTRSRVARMQIGSIFSGGVGSWRAGSTALMFAAGHGHTGVVEALLQEGAMVNSRDDGGYTALMMASLDQLAVVRALLEKGADVNAVAKDGVTALALASKNSSPDSAAIRLTLVAAGAK